MQFLELRHYKWFLKSSESLVSQLLDFPKFKLAMLIKFRAVVVAHQSSSYLEVAGSNLAVCSFLSPLNFRDIVKFPESGLLRRCISTNDVIDDKKWTPARDEIDPIKKEWLKMFKKELCVS